MILPLTITIIAVLRFSLLLRYIRYATAAFYVITLTPLSMLLLLRLLMPCRHFSPLPPLLFLRYLPPMIY